MSFLNLFGNTSRFPQRKGWEHLPNDFGEGIENMKPGNNSGLKVDLVEYEDEYQYRSDLLGVDMKDVDLQVSNGMLHISAKRHQLFGKQFSNSLASERPSVPAKRSVAIPSDADEDSADANFENGVLTVQFTRSSAEKKDIRKPESRPSLDTIEEGDTDDETQRPIGMAEKRGIYSALARDMDDSDTETDCSSE
jgi:HSP20 family molecular chaperone IbpA